MKTLEISDAKRPLADYAGEVGEEPMVLTAGGKPVAVLTSAEGLDWDSLSIGSNPDFLDLLERSRRKLRSEGDSRPSRCGAGSKSKQTPDPTLGSVAGGDPSTGYRTCASLGAASQQRGRPRT